ncbi:NADH:flavin oxidoreductase/NADH oxidase family protein-like protein [Xylaria bambusicola]|uniref:NADH:flavin oxidoreductase/NADH oxidase family protein-like protein n=1 Tax=Xylaria bambusicola TaxID=326684 RepID=UPI002008420E|nr:NADH:flavin oxidoreductase/NADH oxidase family protein-like protein [Xylaria bambusicola]KAI0522090.1 NADH:flavin oxidoreductase/NADH oxidase family protein-like protein [Xylaria bambusicola]
MAESRLFKPLKIGNIEVKHRIAMAPLTRLRATSEYVPVPLMKEYYGQRASVPGTLIISEGTFVSPTDSGGFANAPGIWSQEQIAAWKTITDEVHRKGGFIYCQIAGSGRQVFPSLVEAGGIIPKGPSAIPVAKDGLVPVPMTVEEIKQSIQDFATAATNAISAGFDGVELHAANGFLLDQFIQDVSNQRDDEYGGSIENRSRFVNELMKAVVDAIGPERVGIRLSPWSLAGGMRMADPIPQFTDIIRKAEHLKLAYIHLVESRIFGGDDLEASERLDFAYNAWNGPLLVAGGYTPAEAQKLVDEEYPEKDIVVVFGRHFIANPDLVYRVKEALELNAYHRETFYTSSAEGYVDYPFSPQFLESLSA